MRSIIKRCTPMQRYRIFFFPEKFMGHSFIQNRKSCFFFFRKKNTSLFFFFPGKVHTAFIQIWPSLTYFLIKSVVFFFFRKFGYFCCFFFPGKVHMSFIHSSEKAVFFFRSRKKKKQLFHSFNRFCPKMCKK